MKDNLERVREWANQKIQGGGEPPWAWYQYMKLIETVDAILGGLEAVNPTASSPQSDQHRDMHLRLVDSTYRPDTAQHHPVETPVQMPM